jgi:hypothetical protein
MELMILATIQYHADIGSSDVARFCNTITTRIETAVGWELIISSFQN